jgi:hypothetical protein
MRKLLDTFSYTSQNTIKEMKFWRRDGQKMGEMWDLYKILVEKSVEKEPLGETRSRWENSIKWTLKKWFLGTWNEFKWLRVETSGLFLRAFGFHARGEMCSTVEQLSASQEGICSMELVTQLEPFCGQKLGLYLTLPFVTIAELITSS